MMVDVEFGQILEGGMLICFGASWPVRILTTLRTRRVAGKSLGFMGLVFFGYLLGLTAKLVRAATENEPPELVSILYGVLPCLIFIDFMLYLKYRPKGGQVEKPAD